MTEKEMYNLINNQNLFPVLLLYGAEIITDMLLM